MVRSRGCQIETGLPVRRHQDRLDRLEPFEHLEDARTDPAQTLRLRALETIGHPDIVIAGIGNLAAQKGAAGIAIEPQDDAFGEQAGPGLADSTHLIRIARLAFETEEIIARRLELGLDPSAGFDGDAQMADTVDMRFVFLVPVMIRVIMVRIAIFMCRLCGTCVTRM